MAVEHDPWERARASQHDDVASALAPRERRCPACGEVQRGPGRTCRHCGADLTARMPRWRSRRKLIGAGLAALALAAVALPVVAVLRQDATGERERAAARQKALEAAERVRLTRDAQPVRAAGRPLGASEDPIAHRADLVRRAEALIATDARKRVAAGRIDGDIRGAQCRPFPTTEARRAAEQAARTPAGRYDCVAYTSKFDAPELKGEKRTGLFGYPYWLVVDYPRSELVWCKITPRAGEGGAVLVSVPVPAPCRDPAGPG
jgi:hypothetical protein